MSSPVKVRSAGRFAHAALISGEAMVIAVFERSVYVETPAGLACIGAVGNGPLNVQFDCLSRSLAVGDAMKVDVQDAEIWRPRRAPEWKADPVLDALARLRAGAKHRLPSEGFGHLLDPARARSAPVKALMLWLAEPGHALEDAAGLIGLGPGLTPSGDDFIGGALCALHAARFETVAIRLAGWALPLARAATSRISYAHLVCAAEGECGEAVNDAIVALLSGHAPDLDRIDAIGHTSGWDALAGIALGLDAVLSRPRVT